MTPRWSIVISYGTVTAVTAIIPHTTSVYQLFGLQALSEVARGTAYPTLMSLANFGQAEQDKATAMGFFQTIYSIGMFTGPVADGKIGGWLGYTDAVLEFRLCCGRVNSCSIAITQIDPQLILS